MNNKKAELLMGSAAFVWGASCLLMKIALEGIGPFELVALRFGIAFVAVSSFFWPQFRKISIPLLWKGGVTGFLLFLLFSSLTCGIRHTTASSAGFLASTAVIFVPILESCLKRRLPSVPICISILLTVAGLYLLTVRETLSLDTGSFFCVLSALFYAVYIVIMGRPTQKKDMIPLCIIQFGVVALLSLIPALLCENPVLPYTLGQWSAVLALGLFCSAYCFIIQAIAQQYTAPEKIGLIYALQPVFTALLSFVFLHEILELKGYFGAGLILSGVLVAKLSEIEKKRQHSGKDGEEIYDRETI